MALVDLIRNRGKNKPANLAKTAKDGEKPGKQLAGLAGLALANSPDSKKATDKEPEAYFFGPAEKNQQSDYLNDDRRLCTQCTNLTAQGLCLAARRGEIVASRDFHPVRNILRRCEGYQPRPNDPDKRPGRERWL
jgi:hypothetical protein